jgi:uncharacterized protein YheU (UPF0270 family)
MNEDDEANQVNQAVEIPLDSLSPAALLGVIDDFVLREGTEYGAAEVTLERKRAQVLEQLNSGRAQLLFDPGSETCTIMVRNRPT